MDDQKKQRQLLEKGRWRKLDNTAKLFAAVAGENLSNVFRFSVTVKEDIRPDTLKQALCEVLEEFGSFRVKLRRGFFWNYFEVNNREPRVEAEDTYPCKYIDPHSSHMYLFRVSYYKRRINLEMFHALTDGMGAVTFISRLAERYLELCLCKEEEAAETGKTAAAGKSANGGKSAAGEAILNSEADIDPTGEAGADLTSETDIDPTRSAGETDGTHAVGQRMGIPAEAYGKISVKAPAGDSGESSAELRQKALREEKSREDGYLKYYRKREKRRYESERAMELQGKMLPLDCQSVVHGYLELGRVKALCREAGVSITKYLTALMLWSLIQVYGTEETLKRPVAVNLPINLRSFFDSETMANFFAVTNITWPAGRRPRCFEEVLEETGRQMDEKIVKEKLEETISYNVSNEKKWYVRLVPLFIKHLVTGLLFMRSSRAYTVTLSNLGQVKIKPELKSLIENFTVILGVSKQQKLKCCIIAFEDTLCVNFNSVLNDTRLSDYFFGFLKDRGAEAVLESNGVVDHEHDRGTYPEIFYNRGRIKKLVNILYLVLFAAALLTGAVNVATFGLTNNWWSVIAIGCIAYVAVTIRYSIMRRASLAGILVVESLGAQVLLVLIDYMTGFHGWSFNFAIPSVLLFDVIAAVFLMLVNRMNWQSYFMYQIAITIFSFIPLILWAVGLITKPLMAVITVVLSVSAMLVTVVLGDRSVKNELKRRFHF